MAIPYATTTVSVIRPGTLSGGGIDPLLASYGATAGTTTVSQVTMVRRLRAHIGSPQGTEQIITGDQELVSFRCTTDPYPIEPRDQLLDERNGVLYDVVTAAVRDEIAFASHTQVVLQRSRGLA